MHIVKHKQLHVTDGIFERSKRGSIRPRWLACLMALAVASVSSSPWVDASTATQGTHVQGTHVQGTHVQGTHVQGTHVQGTHVQGTHVQGTHVQGTNRDESSQPWVQGTRLVGLAASKEKSASVLVDILGFRGDTVRAIVRSTNEPLWRYTELHPRVLLGLEWLEYRCNANTLCFSTKYRIRRVVQDISQNTMSEYSDNGDIWLFEVEYSRPDSTRPSDWKNVCPKASSSKRMGIFLDGRWGRDGAWMAGGYTFSCVNGVAAKCVRNWGYKPWKRLFSRSGKAVPLRPLHLACVRAARADYCGDGQSHTMNGTVIDISDAYGFNKREAIAGFAPEAGFTVRSARWVARKRWTPQQDDDTLGTWSRFPTCRRPKAALDEFIEPTLIEVWSSRRPQVKV